MEDLHATLGSFFDVGNLQKPHFSTIQPNAKITAIKDRALAKAVEIAWPIIFDKVFDKMEELFGKETIPKIIRKAWNESASLMKYLDKDKYPPDETFLVPLAEHSISSTHKPYLEVLIDNESVGKIEFEVDLKLTLKGLILTIKDATIREIDTGSCKGEGTVSYEKIKLLKKETTEVKLPGSVEFKDGLRIGQSA